MNQNPLYLKARDPQTGQEKLVLNNKYLYVKNFTQLTASYPLVLAQNATGNTNFTTSAGTFISGNFEINQFLGFEASGNLYTVLLTDSSRNEYMNRPILGRLIFGTAEYPFRLPESIFLVAQSGLLIQVQDLNNVGGSSVYLAFEGSRSFVTSNPDYNDAIAEYARRRYNSYSYFYTTDKDVTTTANQAVQATISVQQLNYYYLIEQIACYSLGSFTFKITDNSSSNFLSNAQVDSRQIAGALPGLAHRLSTKYVVSYNTQLTLDITDTSGKANQIWFCLIGRHIRRELPLNEPVGPTLNPSPVQQKNIQLRGY